MCPVLVIFLLAVFQKDVGLNLHMSRSCQRSPRNAFSVLISFLNVDFFFFLIVQFVVTGLGTSFEYLEFLLLKIERLQNFSGS